MSALIVGVTVSSFAIVAAVVFGIIFVGVIKHFRHKVCFKLIRVLPFRYLYYLNLLLVLLCLTHQQKLLLKLFLSSRKTRVCDTLQIFY